MGQVENALPVLETIHQFGKEKGLEKPRQSSLA